MPHPRRGWPPRWIERLDRLMLVASGAVAGAMIFSMMSLVTIDVLGRYLFGRPTQVSAEMSGYMLVAMIFLGLAYTAGRDRHIAITFVTDRLPETGRRHLALANNLAAMAFAGWLAWFTLQPVLQDLALGTVSLTGTRMPMWLPSAVIPLGFAWLALHLLLRLLARVRAGAEHS